MNLCDVCVATEKVVFKERKLPHKFNIIYAILDRYKIYHVLELAGKVNISRILTVLKLVTMFYPLQHVNKFIGPYEEDSVIVIVIESMITLLIDLMCYSHVLLKPPPALLIKE